MTLSHSITSLGRGYRHLGRYRQIVSVLARHGFGELLGRLPINRYVEAAWGGGEAEGKDMAGLRAAQRLRLACSELGPTFVKLAQLLSTRSDLIPLELARELAKLQDHAPTFSGREAMDRVEHELGRPISEVFSAFEDSPVAAASLAQVHRARLREGDRLVAVKVQRPGARRTVETDLEILEHLASIAEHHGVASLYAQRPQDVIAELAVAIEQELDYTREAAHLKRFGRLFADDPTVKIPEVIVELTTPRVLTMEWLAGRRISEAVADAEPATLDALARHGADAVLRQIFVFGLYHSDPHPGNVYVLEDGVIAFLDFGQIGRLSAAMRALLAELFVHLTNDDIESATHAFLALTSSETSSLAPGRHRMEAEISELVDWHLDRPLGEVQLARLIWRLLEIAHRHRRKVRSELFLVLKALATLDGLVREISPAFDLRSQTGPVLEEVLRQKWSVEALGRAARESGRELSAVLQEGPRDLQRLLRTLERGELRLDTGIRGLGDLHKAHEGALNRLSFAVVLAALLIASSLLALGDFPDWWQGLPLLGVAGYVLSGLIGFRLLWSIFRKGGL